MYKEKKDTQAVQGRITDKKHRIRMILHLFMVKNDHTSHLKLQHKNLLLHQLESRSIFFPHTGSRSPQKYIKRGYLMVQTTMALQSSVFSYFFSKCHFLNYHNYWEISAFSRKKVSFSDCCRENPTDWIYKNHSLTLNTWNIIFIFLFLFFKGEFHGTKLWSHLIHYLGFRRYHSWYVTLCRWFY